ncbi:uncharacterized protein PAF06_007966 [Gastrophryne carolinensis]
MEDGRQSPTLHLDLHNFEEGVGSRYVLTSPRSLEACARLRVKPVELLHKSLREVREENPRASWDQVNRIFLAQEKERCRKLHLCRELRATLTQEGDKPDRGGLPFTKLHSLIPDYSNPPTAGVAQDHPDGGHKHGSRSSSPLPDLKDHSPAATLHLTPHKDPRDYPQAFSFQTPSVDHQMRGHREYTQLHSSYYDDWNPPAAAVAQVHPDGGHKSGSRSSSPLPDRKDHPPAVTLHRAPHKDPRDYPQAFPFQTPPMNHQLRGHREYTQLHSSYYDDWKSPAARFGQHHPNRGHGDYPHSSSSLLDPWNPQTLSTDHQVPSVGHQKGWGSLRRSLSQGDLRPEEKVQRVARKVEREVRVSVSDRDKKIAALMLLKHQEEEMSKKRRHQAQLAWDDLKTEERCIKAALDKRDWLEKLMNHRRRSWDVRCDGQEDTTGYTAGQNAEKYKVLHPEQKTLLKQGLRNAKEDLERKKALQPVDDAGDTFLGSGLQLEEKMLKAFKAKMIKDLQNKKNVQIKNEYEKLRHSKLKEKVENQVKAEEHFKRLSIREKEKKSRELLGQLGEERKKELCQKAYREDELSLMAKLRAMRQEKEQMEYKKQLARLTDHKIRQAKDALERSAQSKAERARELNSVKESVHQTLKKKVEREKENHRKELAQVIKMKERKSDRIRREKEATVEEGRRIARASFQLREAIRQQTKSQTFDQMVLQAQLSASLLRTVP